MRKAAPDFRDVVRGERRMDQRGIADLASFLPSNSGPQEMWIIAGSVRGHLLVCPRPLVTPTLRLLGQLQ